MAENESIGYRLLQPGEEAVISRLITRIFLEFVAPGYSLAGILEFLAFVAPLSLAERRGAGNWLQVAVDGEHIAGVIELRERRHISLLFVERGWQRRGIAAALLEQARNQCRQFNPPRKTITVNSSPYAVPFYMAAGFSPFVEEQQRNGIRYLPMAATL